MKAVVDTTYILSRGAVKDTYNLLADGIVQLVRGSGRGRGSRGRGPWARQHGLERYFGFSIKGEAAIDWDDEKAQFSVLGSSSARCVGCLDHFYWPNTISHTTQPALAQIFCLNVGLSASFLVT